MLPLTDASIQPHERLMPQFHLNLPRSYKIQDADSFFERILVFLVFFPRYISIKDTMISDEMARLMPSNKSGASSLLKREHTSAPASPSLQRFLYESLCIIYRYSYCNQWILHIHIIFSPIFLIEFCTSNLSFPANPI